VLLGTARNSNKGGIVMRGFFAKKDCDFCDDKIGLLGNRKLKDGNMCKNCARQLSPFFSERRQSTVSEIQEQLKYRKENKMMVGKLNITRTLGGGVTAIHLDEKSGKFIVTSARNWQETNPDVIDLKQVQGCELKISESKHELFTKDSEGKRVSYSPPRYEYEFDFYLIIQVNSPWFDEIRFKVNGSAIERYGSAQYMETEQQANEIKAILTQTELAQNGTPIIPKTEKPSLSSICSVCSAPVTPTSKGTCEYCGAPLEQNEYSHENA
jgi:ribosomal protein L37E